MHEQQPTPDEHAVFRFLKDAVLRGSEKEQNAAVLLMTRLHTQMETRSRVQSALNASSGDETVQFPRTPEELCRDALGELRAFLNTASKSGMSQKDVEAKIAEFWKEHGAFKTIAKKEWDQPNSFIITSYPQNWRVFAMVVPGEKLGIDIRVESAS